MPRSRSDGVPLEPWILSYADLVSAAVLPCPIRAPARRGCPGGGPARAVRPAGERPGRARALAHPGGREKRGHLRPPGFLIGDRRHHLAGGVPPAGVAVLDPGGDRGPGRGLGGEVLHGAEFELQRGVPGFDDRVVNRQEPGRPIDWVTPSRAQAAWNERAVYSPGSRGRRNTS